MTHHRDLTYGELHTARIRSGLLSARPAEPSGQGDQYYATDTQEFYMSNEAADDWVLAFTLGSVAGALDDLTDVTISGATTGQVLTYNGSAWVNDDAATGVENLNDLADVDAPTPSNLHILQYNIVSGMWENEPLPTIPTDLNSLTDVTVTSPALTHSVFWNGSAWVNRSPVLNDCSDVNALPSDWDVLMWDAVDERWEGLKPRIAISQNDDEPDVAENKLLAGSGIGIAVENEAGDEALRWSVTGQTKVSSDDTTYKYLESLFSAGSNITITILNPAGNEQIQIAAAGADFDSILTDASGAVLVDSNGNVMSEV